MADLAGQTPGEGEVQEEEIPGQEVPSDTPPIEEGAAEVGTEEDTGEGVEEPNPLEARLAREAQARLASEAEVAFLRGQLEERRRIPATAQPPTADPDDDLYGGIPPAVVLKALQERPLETLDSMLKRHGASIEKRVLRTVDERLSQTTAQGRVMSEADRMLIQNYPEYQTSEEFRAETERYHRALNEQYGDAPANRLTAAAIAYGELARKGRAPQRAAATSIPSGPQRLAPAPPTRIRKSPPPVAGGAGDPFKDFSPEDRARALATCESFGVTPEKYMENYQTMKRKDSGYGRV